MEDGDEGKGNAIIDQKKLLSLGGQLKNELHALWTTSSPDVFDIGYVHHDLPSFTSIQCVASRSTEEEAAHIDKLSEEVGMGQNLKNTFTLFSTLFCPLSKQPLLLYGRRR